MNIGILGAGNVGGTLGKRWAQAGHAVRFGTRDLHDPKLIALLAEAGTNAQAATISEAAAFADVAVLTVPWGAAQTVIEEAGDLSGKILLDVTNPLKPDLSGLSIGMTTSAGEQVAGWAKNARVVKIFNTTGYDNMANPDYNGAALTMLHCGDDTQAKSVAAQLASDLGFAPVDAGLLAQARLLEPFAMLWISLAFGGLGHDFAFHLLRREG